MLFEHLELMLNGSKIAVYITGITILRHQFERNLLATTCNQHRDMRFLYPFGLIDGPMDLVILPFKVYLLLRPHSQNDLNRFAQLFQPRLSIRILVAIGAIFVL